MYNQAIEIGGLAVVTGGASGVGLAAAERFAQAGLSVMLADVSGDTLQQAKERIQRHLQGNAQVHTMITDVSDASAVQALADAAFDAGNVAVLMNNAGIGRPSGSWTEPDAWRETINVNLFGVLNGVQAFLPRMIEAATPAVVINTGSKQGITTPPGNPAYNVSKAGVKVLTEALAYELRNVDAPITAHLFVPGFTYTGMIARHIPQKPDSAWTSEQTVDHLIEHMSKGDFYILCPDNDVSPDRDKRRVTWALGDIVENRPALSRWHPDYADAFADFENSN
ncbi:short-chain dehydrogenase [Ruegeria sp. ANG-S4]|uniref:SDR family NAD(P)-dependent oxidoreductase n=1 Tax=Ruegeria sp. ANG-S4 TaxID=1577904 RepID=UPI00057F1B4F|nr:SDR family NAD(P)-dependent oxidoreductase [Ruegeria sp. ANG-S4]KIC46813.1 short-chain dehydrogenase [Ruegeria sp. ANG-S4]